LRDEIVDLGTRYGIVTPYTSYLALEDAQVSQNFVRGVPVTRGRPAKSGLGNLNAQARTGGTPGMAPSGVGAAPPPQDKTALTITGEQAIRMSKDTRAQQEAQKLKEEPKSNAVRRVAEKTFYLIDGVWTDAEFKADSGLPETVLTFGSEEYFDLLKKTPKLGSFFALGERVVVVFEGRVYRVNAAAP